MSKDNPKHWGFESDEVLEYDSIEERLQYFFDCEFDPDDKMPEEIKIVGFDPIGTPDPNKYAERMLEFLLECLDEDFSSSADEGTEPTDSMFEAAKQFTSSVINEYNVYDCEKVCEKTVKVSDYYTPD